MGAFGNIRARRNGASVSLVRVTDDGRELVAILPMRQANNLAREILDALMSAQDRGFIDVENDEMGRAVPPVGGGSGYMEQRPVNASRGGNRPREKRRSFPWV